jgi:hypothetical protein
MIIHSAQFDTIENILCQDFSGQIEPYSSKLKSYKTLKRWKKTHLASL